MHILVFNGGSSSLTYKVFEVASGSQPRRVAAGKAHRVGVRGSEPSFVEHAAGERRERQDVELHTHGQAAAVILAWITGQGVGVDCVGHRFVHGGTLFTGPTLVDDVSLRKLRACLSLAPLHNPIALDVIEQSLQALPGVAQYVAFDSAFHASIPEYAYTYALPQRVREGFGFRRYGFHGLSYSYVTAAAARWLGRPAEQMRVVACHLGTGGSSVAAVRGGRSLDTSMGYSPLQGLVMSTRSGDVDPMLALYLMAAYDYHPEQVTDLLNKESGLLGLSQFSSDLRDIIQRTDQGDAQSELAVEMYVRRLARYVGGYVVVLGGVEALVFTDDIGVGNPLVRERVCQGLGWCGVVLDPERNRSVGPDAITDVSQPGSRVRILTVPTEEELIICMDAMRVPGMACDTAA